MRLSIIVNINRISHEEPQSENCFCQQTATMRQRMKNVAAGTHWGSKTFLKRVSIINMVFISLYGKFVSVLLAISLYQPIRNQCRMFGAFAYRPIDDSRCIHWRIKIANNNMESVVLTKPFNTRIHCTTLHSSASLHAMRHVLNKFAFARWTPLNECVLRPLPRTIHRFSFLSCFLGIFCRFQWKMFPANPRYSEKEGIEMTDKEI